jgi:hypothetical protein
MDSVLRLGSLLVPITAILGTFLVGGIIAVAVIVSKHRERIAKIERGINPDGPWPQRQ